MDPVAARQLLALWLSGEIDRESAEQLLEVLRSDPDVLEEAARLKSFDRLLKVAIVDAAPDAFAREVALRCRVAAEDVHFSERLHRRLRWKRWVLLAAAACALFSASFLVWQR